MDTRPIGIFDSGVGGFSILNAIQAQLPQEKLLYLADQAHVPYGSRPINQIRRFSKAISHFLLEQDSKMIVIACNTASGAALQYLRKQFRSTPIIGLEPAIASAARITKTGRIAVLATSTTLNAKLYRSTRHLFAVNTRIHEVTLKGIVEEIEADRIGGKIVDAILQKHIPPIVEKGVDTIVLGCTHYPFVQEKIQEIAGSHVQIINPANQVAAHIARTLEEKNLLAPGDVESPLPVLYSTGDADHLAGMAKSLAGFSGRPIQLTWRKDRLELA